MLVHFPVISRYSDIEEDRPPQDITSKYLGMNRRFRLSDLYDRKASLTNR